MIDTILPAILSISSSVAAFIGVLISIRSVKKRREIEVKLFNEIIDQQIKKNKNKKDIENRFTEVENELKIRVEILNKIQMDLEKISESKRDFDKSKYIRHVKYDKYLLEINEAIEKIDSKNSYLLSNALNQGSEIGKVRYLEKITKEALEKTVG